MLSVPSSVIQPPSMNVSAEARRIAMRMIGMNAELTAMAWRLAARRPGSLSLTRAIS